MNIWKKMCKNSPPKFNSKTKSNQLVKITSMHTHIVPCMLFKEHSSRVIHRKVTIAVTAVWVPLILIDCPLFYFFYIYQKMILCSTQKLVSQYFHISWTMKNLTISSFPQMRNFEMSQTVHLGELEL